MKSIINFLVLVILLFVVYAGYQMFFEDKSIKDIGHILTHQKNELKGKVAEKALDMFLKEKAPNLKYRNLSCFNDTEYGLSCTFKYIQGKKAGSIEKLTVYGILDLGLDGIAVAVPNYTDLKIKFDVEGIDIPMDKKDFANDKDMKQVINILSGFDRISAEIVNLEPTTGSISVQSHIALQLSSLNTNRRLDVVLNTYGDDKSKQYFKDFEKYHSDNNLIRIFENMFLDKFNLYISEDDTYRFNNLLYKAINKDTPYSQLVNEMDESTAYYILMAKVAKETHKSIAKKVTDFITLKTNVLDIKMKSKSYDGIKLKKLFSDLENANLSQTKDIVFK